MLKKNDVIKLNITSLTSDGDGVGRCDGIVVFVRNAAIGDVLSVKVMKVKKTVAYARIEEILTPSVDRVISDCPVSETCGGCVYRHISYEAELNAKRQMVKDAISRIGKLDPSLVGEIVPSEKIDGYRNKAQIPISLSKNNEVVMGFYARHSHRVVSCLDCHLSPKIFSEIAQDVYAFFVSRPELVYSEQNRKGVRHLYLRYAETTGDVMVCVVCGAKDFRGREKLFDSLKENYPSIKSLLVNHNPDDTNVILGKENTIIDGTDVLVDELCGLKFEISPLSFYQVNRTQAERLYALARDKAALSGNEVLLDLYCGAGTIGLSMAKDVKEVIGVEIIPDAIENAKKNAERNGITNARFFCGDAESAAQNLKAEGVRPDVIVVDPPRKGLTPALIETIARMSPDRIVYVSCDPATLARDLNLFNDLSYVTQSVIPVDMFPKTSHCETVVLLSR